MPHLPDVVLRSIPAFVLLTVVERVGCRLHPDGDAAGYETKDAATSRGSLAFDALGKIPILRGPGRQPEPRTAPHHDPTAPEPAA